MRITIKKEFNRNFGKTLYVISVNGKKAFFEFTKAEAIKKANKLRKR